MQFILTEAEFNQLKSNQKLNLRLEKDRLQKLCTKICNEMPVQWGWGKTRDDPEYFKPWGCMLEADKDAVDGWYCDECPVQTICPLEDKQFSQ